MALPPHSATMPAEGRVWWRPTMALPRHSPALRHVSLAPVGWMKVITGIWKPVRAGVDGDGQVFPARASVLL